MHVTYMFVVIKQNMITNTCYKISICYVYCC